VQDPARRRLRTLCQTADGFAVAEEDLRLRGPGEFYGARQHGLPDFRAARAVEDLPLLLEARQAAFALLEADPGLDAAEHALLRERVAALRAQIERLDG
jgi:ATP-dependent DNA helicase RecG